MSGQLKRFKSLCSLQTDGRDLVGDVRPRSRSVSESSVGGCVARDLETNWLEGHKDSEVFVMLEQKIDRLNERRTVGRPRYPWNDKVQKDLKNIGTEDWRELAQNRRAWRDLVSEAKTHFGSLRYRNLFVDQCRMLTDLKTDIRSSRSALEKSELAQNKLVSELMKKLLSQSKVKEIEDSGHSFNSRARSLLDAIETKHGVSLDREIRDALVEFLQSDELRQHMVSATERALRCVVDRHFSRDLSALYLPVLHRSQQRMTKHLARVLESGFIELEETTASFSNSVYKACRMLRRTLEHHRELLERPNAVPVEELQQDIKELLEKELKQWREQAIEVMNTPKMEACGDKLESPPLLDCAPFSPQSDSNCSIVDQLMAAAEITKQIEDGDINGAFSCALSAGDLSLVTAACRAAEPRRLRALQQPVLLSLAQQLATDLVRDTQLKCRYLEETLLHLDPLHPATSEHLQLFVSEVYAHLTRFLRQYPKHAARQRVELIVVTVYQLNMKYLDKSNLL